MKNVVVLGGGISGLTLAHQLRKRVPSSVRIQLIEASNRVGGWIRTNDTKDFLFEAGPRGFRPSRNGAEMLHLVEELGLNDKCIQSSGNNRYIFTHGRIEKAPSTLMEFVRWPLALDVLRAALREPFVPPTNMADESIYDFISRRFSPVIAERLLDPMTSGIFGGNIRNLSMRSCFGLLWDMEQAHGSILKAMFRSSPKSQILLDGTPHSDFVKTVGKAMSVSFSGGMQTFTDALASSLQNSSNTEIILQTHAESISQSNSNSVSLSVRRGNTCDTIHADHVFSALPAHRLLPIVQSSAPDLANELKKLPFTSLGVVTFGFKQNIIKNPGFGYLIPTCEGQNVLGVIFDSCSFPEQNKSQDNSSETRLSVFVGGENHPYVASMSPEERISMALKSVRNHLKIPQEIEPTHIESLWYENCIPQYPVGFHSFVDRVESNLAKSLPNLTLVGNSFYGVGLADCVHRSSAAALAFATKHKF